MVNLIDETKHLVMKRKKNKTAKKRGGVKLIEKAGLAIKHEFYLEASWILSSLFERKLHKILEKLQPPSQTRGLTFEQSIKRVKYWLLSSKSADLTPLTLPTILTPRLNVGLIDEIRSWKNHRNDILKDMPDIHVSQARIEKLATEGVKIYKELNKAVKSFKAAEESSDNNAERSG
jgi:hypothetical protein